MQRRTYSLIFKNTNIYLIMFNQIFILYIALLSLSYKQKWWYFQISNLQNNSGGYQRISFIHDEWEMCCHRRILPTLELLIMFTKCVHTYTCTVVDRAQEMEDFFTLWIKLTLRRYKYCTIIEIILSWKKREAYHCFL